VVKKALKWELWRSRVQNVTVTDMRTFLLKAYRSMVNSQGPTSCGDGDGGSGGGSNYGDDDNGGGLAAVVVVTLVMWISCCNMLLHTLVSIALVSVNFTPCFSLRIKLPLILR